MTFDELAGTWLDRADHHDTLGGLSIIAKKAGRGMIVIEDDRPAYVIAHDGTVWKCEPDLDAGPVKLGDSTATDATNARPMGY